MGKELKYYDKVIEGFYAIMSGEVSALFAKTEEYESLTRQAFNTRPATKHIIGDQRRFAVLGRPELRFLHEGFEQIKLKMYIRDIYVNRELTIPPKTEIQENIPGLLDCKTPEEVLKILPTGTKISIKSGGYIFGAAVSGAVISQRDKVLRICTTGGPVLLSCVDSIVE